MTSLYPTKFEKSFVTRNIYATGRAQSPTSASTSEVKSVNRQATIDVRTGEQKSGKERELNTVAE
jgi:hypothetical protein